MHIKPHIINPNQKKPCKICNSPDNTYPFKDSYICDECIEYIKNFI